MDQRDKDTQAIPTRTVGEDTTDFATKFNERTEGSTEGQNTEGYVKRWRRREDAPASTEGEDTEGNGIRRPTRTRRNAGNLGRL